MREFIGYVLASVENMDKRVTYAVKQNRRVILLGLLCFGMIHLQDKKMRIMDAQLSRLEQKLNTIQKEEDKE